MPSPLTPAIQTDAVTVFLGDTVSVLPMLDPAQIDTGRAERDRVGTSNIWWSI